MPDRMTNRMPDRRSEYMSERLPHRMSDRMSERMPDRISDGMPDKWQIECYNISCQRECQRECQIECQRGCIGFTFCALEAFAKRALCGRVTGAMACCFCRWQSLEQSVWTNDRDIVISVPSELFAERLETGNDLQHVTTHYLQWVHAGLLCETVNIT